MGFLRRAAAEEDILCSLCKAVIPAGAEYWYDDGETNEDLCQRCYIDETSPPDERSV